VSQFREIGRINLAQGSAVSTREQERAKVLPVLVFAYEFAHIFTAGPKTARVDLFIDKGFESLGQGYVHGAHRLILGWMAKFGKKIAL
jgi:hypothetical protein